VKDFKISEHFTFFELTNTTDHPHLLEANREHFAIEPYLSRLQCAAEYLLENTRDEIEMPIYILSGGRCPALNRAVGGVPTSQHLFDLPDDGAFDLTVSLVPIEKIAEEIWFSGMMFYQMRVYSKRNFLHLGMPRSKDNLQMAWVDGIRPEWAR
jgi:hypothetical protein